MKFHVGDDDGFAQGHAEAGFQRRVQWVKSLRAALLPFAERRATDKDVEHAKQVLDETKEWL